MNTIFISRPQFSLQISVFCPERKYQKHAFVNTLLTLVWSWKQSTEHPPFLPLSVELCRQDVAWAMAIVSRDKYRCFPAWFYPLPVQLNSLVILLKYPHLCTACLFTWVPTGVFHVFRQLGIERWCHHPEFPFPSTLLHTVRLCRPSFFALCSPAPSLQPLSAEETLDSWTPSWQKVLNEASNSFCFSGITFIYTFFDHDEFKIIRP